MTSPGWTLKRDKEGHPYFKNKDLLLGIKLSVSMFLNSNYQFACDFS